MVSLLKPGCLTAANQAACLPVTVLTGSCTPGISASNAANLQFGSSGI